jgi:hypothetical protein
VVKAKFAKGARPEEIVRAIKSLGIKRSERALAGYYGLPMFVDGVPQCIVLGNWAYISTNLVYAYPFNTTDEVDWQYTWFRPFVYANNQYYGGSFETGGWVNEANGSSAARGYPQTFDPLPLSWYHESIPVVYVVWWYDYYTGQYFYDAAVSWGPCNYW